MRTLDFLNRVQERAGGGQVEQTERVCVAVLTTLAEVLSRLEAEALAEDLPADLAGYMKTGPHGQAMKATEFHRRVAERASVEQSVAAEWTTLVLQGVAEAVGPQAAQRARADLPEPLARQLAAPAPHAPPPPHLKPERRTLAEGRPGGQRPLYAARPDSAHSQSVARSDEPHADTKLSSAHGTQQEREGRTLATAHPANLPGESNDEEQ